ncbi:MAG: hypothetical protein BWY83_01071 [bacterium ADurb.Bin478]|nr:MAG: hypothetical protein BWY83_01071 [bacterium ADurb.Bin478]
MTKVNMLGQRTYRSISLAMAVVFAVVGLLFLFCAGQVLHLFNTLALQLVLPQSSEEAVGFYLLLAVAYMYVVTQLAFLMYRHPENSLLPFLLINAKAASAMLSVLFFVFHEKYLIYIVNAVVDGSIALAVAWLRKQRR